MDAESEDKRKINMVELLLAFILFLLTIIAITPPKQTLSKESVTQIQKSEDKHLIASQTDFGNIGFCYLSNDISSDNVLQGKEKMVMSWKEKEM